jgi:hypothetical protein
MTVFLDLEYVSTKNAEIMGYDSSVDLFFFLFVVLKKSEMVEIF